MNKVDADTSRRAVARMLAGSLLVALIPHVSEAQEGKPMTGQVVEIVTFNLVEGFSEADFLSASQAVAAFLSSRKGFVSRRLSRSRDGSYTDHVVWASLADAEAAMEASMKDPSLGAFMQAIDMQSIKLDHQELLVSIN